MTPHPQFVKHRSKFFAIALVALGLWILVPVAVVMVKALLPAAGQADLWQHLWAYQLPRLLGNTVFLMIGTGLFAGILGVSLAWLLTQYEFVGRRYFEWLMVLPLALPVYVMAFAQLGIFDYTGWVQTYLRAATGRDVQAWFALRSSAGVSWVMALALYPYVYLLTRSAFRTMGARALEVGQALGYSPLRTFWRVALPMARPWWVGGLTLVLMETVTDFGAVSVFNYDTLTTGVYQSWFALFSLPTALRLALSALLLVGVLVWVEHWARSHQVYAGIGTAQSSQRRHLSIRATILAWFWLCLVLGLAFVLPLTQLLVWAVPDALTHTDSAWTHLLQYVIGSVSLASMAALLVTGIALLFALLKRRVSTQHKNHRGLINWWMTLITMGYAIPGTVLAVGVFVPIAFLDNLLLAWGLSQGAWFKGSLAALLWAYVVRFLAVAYAASDSALQRVRPVHEEMAFSLGYSGWRLWTRVHVPMMRTGVWTAVLLVFVDVMKEIPITLMMRPMGWDTLATRIFALTSEGMWREAAIPALALVMVSLLPVWILVRQTQSSAQLHTDKPNLPADNERV